MKQASEESLAVGYIMKPSRSDDFYKRGAFPSHSTPSGLIFIPFCFNELPQHQLHYDIILQKVTDEMMSVELCATSESSFQVNYTSRVEEFQRYIKAHPDCIVIDPLEKLFPLIDRSKMLQLLSGLEIATNNSFGNIRGPRFVKVDRFSDPNLMQMLLDAELKAPYFVKPQVSCGVPDAHNMAIVFSITDFTDLKVPLPAVIQEHIDHSATILKVYVLGGKVFHAVKMSTPTTSTLIDMTDHKPLIFNSLSSPPTVPKDFADATIDKGSKQYDLQLVANAASWLHRKLDLTIFGFDVVVQEGTCDHVIVDINYFPSFKEIPDEVAIPAFWEALRKRYKSQKG